jgi:hypothetical protein
MAATAAAVAGAVVAASPPSGVNKHYKKARLITAALFYWPPTIFRTTKWSEKRNKMYFAKSILR